jgi:membrane-bound metal-dependent hydrolase YbcI (DUF457 family)
MTRQGHHASGILIGIAVSAMLLAHVGWLCVLALPGCAIGANLPDRIEWSGRERWCEHRTITHWWPWWVALTAWALWSLPHAWAIPVLGVGIGAISHLLLDWPNPTGIPILHPWKRHSLRLWRSGQREPLILIVLAGFAAICLYGCGVR